MIVELLSMPFWIKAMCCYMPCITNLVLLQSMLNSNSPEVIPQSRSMIIPSGVASSSGQTVAFCHWFVWKTVGSCGERLRRNLGCVQTGTRRLEAFLCFLVSNSVKARCGKGWCSSIHTANVHYSTALCCWVRTNLLVRIQLQKGKL